ncbi:MAG: hypothetical protein LBR84_03880 [Tannerella sp.]|nr:hypothetical protein [Tannerella sp.]
MRPPRAARIAAITNYITPADRNIPGSQIKIHPKTLLPILPRLHKPGQSGSEPPKVPIDANQAIPRMRNIDRPPVAHSANRRPRHVPVRHRPHSPALHAASPYINTRMKMSAP